MRLKNSLRQGIIDTNEVQLDTRFGGQQGFLPSLGRKVPGDSKTYAEWINNAAYVSRNLIAVVIQTPGFFKLFDDASITKDLQETYVDLMELEAETIEGLQATLTVEVGEHLVGSGGEMQQETVKSSRARSNVTYTWREKLGKPINRFLDILIRYGDMDPDTGAPLITSVSSKFKKGNIYTPNYKAGTVMFFEPDLAMKNVVEAFLVTNFFPLTAGEITAKRDLSAAGEMKVYSVEFATLTTSNAATKAYAQKLLDGMTILKTNPDEVPVFVSGKDAGIENYSGGYNGDSTNNPTP